MKTKKNKIVKNLTKKCKPTQIHANTFNSFEKKYESKFNIKTQKREIDLENALVKLFKTPFTPTKYTAQSDYYTYINYQWINEQSKEAEHNLKYYVQIDSFRITQEKVYYELIDIVKEYIKNNK